MEEGLIAVFGRVLETAKDGETDAETGHQIRTLLAEQGGIDTLAERCQTVAAWHGNNDLPLLWPIHANTRNLGVVQNQPLLGYRGARKPPARRA